MSTVYLTVPGLGNSGPQHWQTFWEKRFPDKFRRIEQAEWETPACKDWTAKIEAAVQEAGPENVVLLAHSLGCIAVAHWAKDHGATAGGIKGVFLVAPSDCEAPSYTFDTKGFSPIPLGRLPCKSLLVASTNDEYVSFDRAKEFAHAWGSEFVDLGDSGHINGDAGFGEWNEGLELLSRVSGERL
jgi:serine hydrolase